MHADATLVLYVVLVRPLACFWSSYGISKSCIYVYCKQTSIAALYHGTYITILASNHTFHPPALGQVLLPGLPEGAFITGAAAGRHHSLLVARDGASYAMGLNTMGQCGIGARGAGRRNCRHSRAFHAFCMYSTAARLMLCLFLHRAFLPAGQVANSLPHN